MNEASIEAMKRLPDEGVSSFKLFMAYPGVFYSDDAQILKAMQVSRDTGMLTMMHAENGPAIDVLAAQLVEQGKTDPYYHGIARAWEMEEEATHCAIMLAKLTGAPLYVVHVSAKQAVEQLAWARDKGQNVYGETCPQYLYLARRPARREERRVRRSRGQVGVLDAAPPAMPRATRTPCGRPCARTTCRWSPRPLPVLHEGPEGARPRRLPEDPERHRLDRAPHGPHVPGRGDVRSRSSAGWSSRAPRRRACSGCTGGRASSSPAPTPTSSTRRATSIGLDKTHHMNMDYSAWEGYEIDGKVDTVLSRGKVVVEKDAFVGAKGDGQFLKRGLSQYLI